LIAYASAYLKCHHPAAFLTAMLNCFPLGFYHPATLVKDAQRHGVQVMPIDVTCSDWKCTLEENQNPHPDPLPSVTLTSPLPRQSGRGTGISGRGAKWQSPPPSLSRVSRNGGSERASPYFCSSPPLFDMGEGRGGSAAPLVRLGLK